MPCKNYKSTFQLQQKRCPNDICSDYSSSTISTTDSSQNEEDDPRRKILEVTECIDFIKRRNPKLLPKIIQSSFSLKSENTSDITGTYTESSSTSSDIIIHNLSSVFNLPIIKTQPLLFTESLLIGIKYRGMPQESYSKDNLCNDNEYNFHEKPKTYCPPIPTLIDVCNNLHAVGGVCINVSGNGDNTNLNGYIAAQFSAICDANNRDDNTGCTAKSYYTNGNAKHGGGFDGGNSKGNCIEIVTVIDPCLKLVNEKKVHTICEENCKEEKSLLVFKDYSTNELIAVKKYVRDNKEPKRQRGVVQLNGSNNLVLAGHNLILLRYVALIQYCGTFQAWTLDMDGNICFSNYQVDPPKIMYINKKRYSIIKITRIIHRQNDIENLHEIYHYLPSGHLIKYESCFSEYVWHINPLSKLPPYNFIVDRNENVDSKNDAQLLAMYLDKKFDLEEKLRQDIFKHRPEIKNIIRDYVMCLVNKKPENVLQFTMEYFMRLRDMYEKRDECNEIV